MLVGYARVSSTGQSLALQIEALEAAGCEKVYCEKASGRSTSGRTQLDRALDQLRDGDTLVVTRLDRLARSVTDLHRLMSRLQEDKVSFRCLQQGGVDTLDEHGEAHADDPRGRRGV